MFFVIIPDCQLMLVGCCCHSEHVGQLGGDLFAFVAGVGVPARDDAAVLGTGRMGFFAIVVSVVGAEAPATSLPEWTLQLWVVRFCLVALETVGEDWFASLPLAQYGTLGFFLVRGSLGCMDTRDGHGWWSSRMGAIEMGGKTGADS